MQIELFGLNLYLLTKTICRVFLFVVVSGEKRKYTKGIITHIYTFRLL